MMLAPLVRFVVRGELLSCEARVCHEGTAVGEKDLREVQDRASQGNCARDLRGSQAQAASRLARTALGFLAQRD